MSEQCARKGRQEIESNVKYSFLLSTFVMALTLAGKWLHYLAKRKIGTRVGTCGQVHSNDKTNLPHQCSCKTLEISKPSVSGSEIWNKAGLTAWRWAIKIRDYVSKLLSQWPRFRAWRREDYFPSCLIFRRDTNLAQATFPTLRDALYLLTSVPCFSREILCYSVKFRANRRKLDKNTMTATWHWLHHEPRRSVKRIFELKEDS
jgi:hypothetical protein